MTRAWLLAALGVIAGCFGDGFWRAELPVELRVSGLAATAARMRVDVTAPEGHSKLERDIDATFGAVVRFTITNGDLVEVAVDALDVDGAVIQHGLIASALTPFAGPLLWRITLVPVTENPVVCDGLDNDGNGAIDEDECAE